MPWARLTSLLIALTTAALGVGGQPSVLPPMQTTRPVATTIPATRPNTAFRLASYNILRNAQRGQAAVVADLDALHADVICLQEVYDRNVALSIAKALGITQVATSKGGQVILSRLPLSSLGNVPNLGDAWHDAPWAEITLPAGEKIRVVSVHLASVWPRTVLQFFKSEGQRSIEIAALKAAWEAAGKPSLVIAGDFNQLPDLPNYKTMTATWSDALGSLGHRDGTFELGYRLDYILLSSDLAPLAGGVVTTSRSSDHRPIYADLALTASPPTTLPTLPPK